MELADREQPVYKEDAPEFFSLIPLPEVLGELLRAGPGSRQVMGEYARTIDRFGAEFILLLQTPLEEIRRQSPLLAEAVNRIRSGRVIRQPGFDGEPGVIRVFAHGEQDRLAVAGGIFGDAAPRRGSRLSTNLRQSCAVHDEQLKNLTMEPVNHKRHSDTLDQEPLPFDGTMHESVNRES
jgi:hypothetical protein